MIENGIYMPTEIEVREIDSLKPYDRNARIHSEEQIQNLAESIRRFGFLRPLLITGEGDIVCGHGRVEGAKLAGLTRLPCILAESLTDEQRRAFILADNRLAEQATWDKALVSAELIRLRDDGFDIRIAGFSEDDIVLTGSDDHFWDEEGESTEEYEDFVDKFKPKLTTDDCYTPAPVYEAVKDWVLSHYNLGDAKVIRPFYPGADYQKAEYPEGCVVIDNPPFSILSEICRWYQENGVRFFLFAPGLTLFSIASGQMNYIPLGMNVTYDNGASIATSFVTNMGEYKIEVCPDLYQQLAAAVDDFLAGSKFTPPRYVYPDCIVSVATSKLAKHGQSLKIKDYEVSFTRALDAQRAEGKAIYGGGFMISHEATKRKIEAESAATQDAAENLRRVASIYNEDAISDDGRVIWPLTEREQALIARLGHEHVDE